MLSDHATLYAIVSGVLIVLAVAVIPPRRRPTAGMAWILLIVILPIPGWLAFLLLGHYKLPRSRRDVQARINATIDAQVVEAKKQMGDGVIDAAVSPTYRSVERLATGYGRLPVMAGNSVEILTDYGASLDAIVRDIDSARQAVWVEYYAMTLDSATRPFFEALAAAKRRGVDVRVLYDTWGSRSYDGKKPMLEFLESAGIAYRAILPLRLPGTGYVRPDLRNHRKIVVVDNAIGFTGSQNMIDRTYHRKDDIYYDELVVRASGPIALELATLFMTDWVSEGGSFDDPIRPMSADPSALPGASMQVLPSGPGFDGENNLAVFTHLLHLARTDIAIVNPYFVPSEALLEAIISAAHRGVRVRMINSEAMDQWMIGYAQRSYYGVLLEAGVEIYLYRAPTLLHSKYIVVDGEVAIVGSSNMDMRSFELNSELSLICYDEAVAREMTAITATYQAASNRLTLDAWRQRPRYRRTLESITRLTSAIQ
ncbi:cardiolipin synthase [Demequina sp. NBRC 110057]|uniref:cardiolipin synthase n=1 Tax=Demequina sp. NBRC 110057 TaxID=1570346 RepID=UPI000A054588|nr:cardiolipin synthase [Demequina sp. NBRC 110057]